VQILPANTPPRAAWPLESALIFTFFAHAAAMLTMAAFLLPGMPGGSSPTAAARIDYVANHPALWRIGWLGWQVTALSDLMLSVALLATKWISKPIAAATVLITIAAILPDQIGQAIWSFHGPAMARAAIARGDLSPYLTTEARLFRCVAGWGGAGYLLGAFGWTWCFAAAAGTWSKRLTWLSIATWGLFAASVAVIFIPPSVGVPAWLSTAVSGANAVAFVLLLVWLADVAEQVLRRARPGATTGSRAPWRHPRFRLLDLAANSRFVRAIGEHSPILAMASDISNVVYVNYLVPAEKLEPLLPPMLQMQRLGPGGSRAMFSILTYNHGHFGPICFGPMRRFWPGPVQSNWRIYVVDPRTGRQGVHFVTTAITSTPHALATRILSEGVPMHVPADASVGRDADGSIRVSIERGSGTAPDFRGVFRPAGDRELPSDWNNCFSSYTGMLDYCVPQDRAIAPQPWFERIARQEISLGIAADDCVPMTAKIDSAAAVAIVGDAIPVCFRVDRVAFRFLGESFD
jgi:hypothetical protein